MKQPTKAKLNNRGIHNPYGIARCQDSPKVFISYSPEQTGRAHRTASWDVSRTDARVVQEPRRWGGFSKEFPVSHPKDSVQEFGDPESFVSAKEFYREEAIRWATQEFGVAEWERSPFGSYHPKGTMDRIPEAQFDTYVDGNGVEKPI